MLEKFFITTTIPYVNGDPHIGHALEFVEADVISRWRRARGDPFDVAQGKQVFFLTGTDENSLKNVQAAEKAGVSVRRFVEAYAEKFRDLLSKLNISNDGFIRTTEERHFRGAQKLWKACNAKGDIYKKKYRGLYCVGCEAFYLEKDLENGLCPEHKTKPEVVEEENYFFRLSKYSKELERLITSGELSVIPDKRRNEALAFIRDGLEDFSISRSKERAKNWGVPVPGDPAQIMYVWFDALSNYINAVGYGSDEEQFSEWWQGNPNIVHILGKGVLRFHAIYWPAMLLSAGVRLPKEEFIHGYFTIEGEKMSKSLGNAVNAAGLVKKYGTDAVRYFLLRGISAYDDGNFSVVRFEELYNADLANGIGNLVQRVTTLAERADIRDFSAFTGIFEREVQRVKREIGEALHRYEFHRAIESLWELVRRGDLYVNDAKPWEKEGKEQQQILTDLTSLILHIASTLHIFLPGSAEEIASRFGIRIADLKTVEEKPLRIRKGETLFKRI